MNLQAKMIKVNEVVYIDKKQGAEMLLSKITTIDTDKFMEIGKYRGFLLKAAFDGFTGDYKICICGKKEYKTELGSDSLGNITRLNNLIDKIPELLEKEKSKLESLKSQIENAKKELEKPFDREEELKEKTARLEELNSALKLSEATPEIIAELEEKEIKQSQKSSHER